MAEDKQVVGQACNVLAYYKHCRQPAARLSRCQRASQGDCEAATAAFKTCAASNSQAILSDLVAIASTRCSDMVQRYERCQAQYGELKCEHLDAAALECAAKHVLHSMAS